MAPERGAHRRHVGDITLAQRPVPDGLAMSGHEIVVDHRVVARPAERLGRVAPDVASAAGDQYRANVSGQWRNT